VSNAAQVEALFAATLARFDTIDVLVNNAGLTNTERHFLDADESWWNRIIAVNLSGAFLCGQRAAQIMARKGAGVIINMSSGGATRAHRGNAAYDAAKGGIEALTRAMALDLGPYGVRVNGLVPGSIDSKGMATDLKRARGEPGPDESSRTAMLIQPLRFIFRDSRRNDLGLPSAGGRFVAFELIEHRLQRIGPLHPRPGQHSLPFAEKPQEVSSLHRFDFRAQTFHGVAMNAGEQSAFAPLFLRNTERLCGVRGETAAHGKPFGFERSQGDVDP
jgi:NAD(P)-dependent dehydrogenase (short-subunit alcohol dehydrogenase family)